MIQHARLLESLIHFLSSQKIEYAILGGIAVILYGKPRVTDDTDVNILLAKKDLSTFLKKAGKFGFYPRMPAPVQFAQKTGVVPMAYFQEGVKGKCDFIMAENAIELAGIRRARMLTLGSLRARFITAEDLVVQKLVGSRPRDVDDVINVLRRQKGQLDLGYIRGWLQKVDALEGKAENPNSLSHRFNKLLKES